MKSTFFKVTCCERSIFCWILSEITIFAVTCSCDNRHSIRNISKTKQTSARKHTEHCFTHLNKTAWKIRSVFDKVRFWVKTLMPFFHWTLQLWCSNYISIFHYCCQLLILIIKQVTRRRLSVHLWGGPLRLTFKASKRPYPRLKMVSCHIV